MGNPKMEYKSYECRMCGYVVKADPLRVPHICSKCNSFYPFQRKKTEKNQFQLLHFK